MCKLSFKTSRVLYTMTSKAHTEAIERLLRLRRP
jgi:hypothetical protein